MKRILAEAADPKSVDELNRIRSTLTHSQLAITEWLRMLLKDGEYLGDVDKQKLSRIDGMVIAVVFSAEEYPGDQRPIREVITAYRLEGECPLDITKRY